MKYALFKSINMGITQDEFEEVMNSLSRVNSSSATVELNLKELQHISKVLDRHLKKVKRLGVLDGDGIKEREFLLNKISYAIGKIYDELYDEK